MSKLIDTLLRQHYNLNSKPIVMPSDKKKQTFDKLRSELDNYHEHIIAPIEETA